MELARLGRLAFLQGMPRWALVRLADAATEEELPAGRLVLRQSDRARAVYFLLAGSVQILIRVAEEDLLVGVLRRPGELVGWSAFRAPYRYTASVRCEQPSRLVRVPAAVFEELFERDPALAYQTLQRVAAGVADRLEHTRERLCPPPQAGPSGRGIGQAMSAETLELLAGSPFFEGFDPRDLAELASHARVVAFRATERVFAEAEPATALFLLVSGAVELSFATRVDKERPRLVVQTLTHAGQPIGWSAMVEPYAYRATATAKEPTRLLALDRDVLDRQAKAHPSFGVALMRAIVGVVGDRLRATRLRLVARRYDDVVVAVRDLLEQSGTQLSVSSPLHKLPYYLQHRLTLADAFHTLDLLRLHGDQAERSLAALCADILERVHQELRLYQQLQAIYEAVAGAPATIGPEEVRRRSMLEFRRLFAGTRHRIVGWGRLPERPGHIVIMNHLDNHPDNLLPNNFTLTLDTHFVASMILFERYGQAPIRVIRKSRPDEYGHQRFYDRLGYVYAYSGHVDADDEDPCSSPEARRRFFLDAAGSCLRMGKNVVICPEGACAATEESPRRFRPGAFRLAAHVHPEPLLVPIAVANFDKKLTRTTVAAVVHEPFRLSDAVADPTDEDAVLAFINHQLYPRFRGWVREAAALAGPPDD
jgi:CRP-like cAMP-binding protein/1-acyl-sn-glycerol-3-phosphate acyltransferase